MAMNTYEKGKLYSMALADLKADPDQPRKFFDPQAPQSQRDDRRLCRLGRSATS
jgi:hypothetical protein